MRRRGRPSTRPRLCAKHASADWRARKKGTPSPVDLISELDAPSKPLVDVGSGRVTELAKEGLERGAADAGKSLYAFVNELLEVAGLKLAKKHSKR